MRIVIIKVRIIEIVIVIRVVIRLIIRVIRAIGV